MSILLLSEFSSEIRPMETMHEIMDALILIAIIVDKTIVSKDFLFFYSTSFVPLHSFR